MDVSCVTRRPAAPSGASLRTAPFRVTRVTWGAVTFSAVRLSHGRHRDTGHGYGRRGADMRVLPTGASGTPGRRGVRELWHQDKADGTPLGLSVNLRPDNGKAGAEPGRAPTRPGGAEGLEALAAKTSPLTA